MTCTTGVACRIASYLDASGLECIVRTITSGAYDPTSGTYASATASDVTTKCIMDRYDQRLIDGTRIRADDWKVTLPASAPAVVAHDQLVISGETFEIIAVSPIYAGGTIVQYEVQARK